MDARQWRRRTRLRLGDGHLLGLAALSCLAQGCDNDLGPCNEEAAQQLVYSSSGLAATKGQALMHDSCGQGTFCHSTAARGAARFGAPLDLNYDVLPSPDALRKILDQRQMIWQQIDDGHMPPSNHEVGNSGWSFDLSRSTSAPQLAPLSDPSSRAALRNWLACGAPSVSKSQVPSWLLAGPDAGTPQDRVQSYEQRRWTRIHDIVQAGCVKSGCHAGQSSATDGGALSDLTMLGGECALYRSLVYRTNACGAPLVVIGDPDHSALIHKLEDDPPACGSRMPLNGVVNQGLTDLLRDWIAQGAWAPQCGSWSSNAPRPPGLDAGGGQTELGWSELHESILAPKCATAGCHTASTQAQAGMLDLSERCGAWRALQKSGPCGARVAAGNPEGSSLYDKISSDAPRCQGSMPPTGHLPKREIDAIRAWIEAGAMAGECED
jgi:hypothetical protein